MNFNLYSIAMDSPLSTNTALRCIIIASSATLVMPNHTYLLQPMLSQPFFSESKQRISIMFHSKLSDTHIRVINSIISILIFVRNPSLEDDSDKTHNLKLSNSPCHDSRTTLLFLTLMETSTKKLASPCIRIIWNESRRPTEDEIILDSGGIL